MDEYQDYVPFDESRDFEDGQFIDGEFVSRGLKRVRQQSKEDAIYGVFGEDSDGDDRPRGRRGMGRKELDLTRPVGFVSKGVNNSKSDVESNKVEVSNPSRGQEESGGLGFRPSFASLGRMEDPQDQEDDEDEVLATALGSRIKKQVAERRQTGHEARELDKQWQQVKAADPSFATFEKHTKGIGMKLLTKMGFKPGEGLGAGKGGIAKPIEVTLRPKGQALGFGSRHRDEEEEEEEKEGMRQRVDASSKASTSKAVSAVGGGRMWKKKNKVIYYSQVLSS
jgi:tuftelin-interacting protein 11